MAGTGMRTGSRQKVGQAIGGKQQLLARVTAAVCALNTQQVRAAVQQQVDLGYIVRRDEESLCPICGGAVHDTDICPRSGLEPGEVEQREEPSEDEELPRGEDLSPGREEEDPEEDARELSLFERLREVLLGIGWTVEDADDGGLVLARVWEAIMDSRTKGGQFSEKRVQEEIARDRGRRNDGLHYRLLEPPALAAITAGLNTLAEQSAVQEPTPSEIAFDRMADGTWAIRVEDPLENLLVKQHNGKVPLASSNTGAVYAITVEQFCALLNQRRYRLEKIAEDLLEKRPGFFSAPDRKTAEASLLGKLTQKSVAKELKIPETTLSAWCSGGKVWMRTAFGPYALADFFSATNARQLDGWIEAALENHHCPSWEETYKRNQYVRGYLVQQGVHIESSQNSKPKGHSRKGRRQNSPGGDMVLAWDTVRKAIEAVAKKLQEPNEPEVSREVTIPRRRAAPKRTK